ncbi:zinc ribbon domain-containing protein [Micromonospora coerulea]|uniref:zinc ribbon domain-containing protein n=1 Tax=Micromonospora coerulea TaxID=47856 RepID=UPI001906A383|nr:zinc ribbon domain-containing protein [Micromonospora veneta]
MFSYRLARPWLARLGLLGQLVLLTSLGAAPAHAAPADRAVATAGVISHRDGAAATAVDAGPVAGTAVRLSDGTVTPVKHAAAYGPTEADAESSSPRTNGALLGGLLGALGGLLIAVTVKLVRRAVERWEQRAAMPFPRGAPVPVPRPPTAAAPPPPAAAPASVVGFAPPAVPANGGSPATVWVPTVGTAVPPPAWTAPPVVGPPQPARPPGRPPQYGPRCARCRELVPEDAAYCGECGLSQLEPPFGEEAGGAGRRVGRLFRDRPGVRRRWGVVAALAAGVVLVAAVTFHQQASPMSPPDTVEAYFDALADRDADRARSLLSADYAKRAPMILTSGGALRDPGYHPPRHLRIKVVVVRDDVAEMEGEYELDGKRQKTGLYLIRDGGGGERRPWSINYLPQLPPPSGEYGFEALVIAGTRAPAGLLEAVFHGSYLVSLPDHPIREVTAPVIVHAGAREGGVLRTRMRDSARESIETQVRAYLDRCAASTELMPKGCPFSAYSSAPVTRVTWRITRYPPLEITLGSTGDAQVVGGVGEATATTARGEVLPGNTSFLLYGDGRAAGDKVLFVPR